MSVEQQDLMRIVYRIYSSTPDDIQCDEAATQMMQCADLLLSDDDAQSAFPTLWRHFHVCVDCYREYRMLLEIMQYEAALLSTVTEDAAPGFAEHPVVKALITLPDTIRRLLDTAASVSFPGFTPMPANALRGSALTEKPVQVAFPAGLTLALNVLPGLMDSSLRLLTCEVLASDPEQSELAAGVVAQLFSETSGELEQEEELVGRQIAFDDLYTDRYTLLLMTDAQTYGVTGIDLSNI